MICNAEMALVSSVKDESLMAEGFEWHTYLCPKCGDSERRFVFDKRDKQENGDERAEAALAPEPTDVSPIEINEPAPRQDFFKRVLSKIRIGS